MNSQLVDSLVLIINSLTIEERVILQQKLIKKNSLQEQNQQLDQLKKKNFQRRQGKPLSPEPEDVIDEIRQERNAYYDQLLNINQKL
jgi:hypothetical protein